MPELRVPTLPERPFEAYFRGLVRGSLLRSAEAEYAYHLQAGHGLRARRAARLVARARALADEQARAALPPRFGRGLLATTGLVWAAGVAVLVWSGVSYGLHSWATGVADLVVVGLTFAWFVVAWGSDVRHSGA